MPLLILKRKEPAGVCQKLEPLEGRVEGGAGMADSWDYRMVVVHACGEIESAAVPLWSVTGLKSDLAVRLTH